MRVRTCLRYPGGKFYGFKYLKDLLNVEHEDYIEVFVGGASAFLGKELVKNNWINDKDQELINFYKIIQNKHTAHNLYNLLTNEIVTKSRYKEVCQMVPRDELERAFKYFYLNRTSFSGIMNKPRWGYMLGSSVTPDKWVERIKPVADKLNTTKITSLDFRDVISNGKTSTLIYLDPPYFEASKKIYVHEFVNNDHYDLMEMLKIANYKFILSYNNCKEIKEMYKWANIKDESWVYFMSEQRRTDGKELIITNF